MAILTDRQAYEAMVLFLERYYETNKADEIMFLLSNVSFGVWSDEMPNDPAMWFIWLECVRKALADSGNR